MSAQDFVDMDVDTETATRLAALITKALEAERARIRREEVAMRGQNFVDSDYGKGYIDGHRAGVEDARARCRREEVEPLREALRRLIEAANDLREASEEAYSIARIPAIPFVRAGNVISEARAVLRAADERGR